MPHKFLSLFKGRALPALFISSLLLLFSCTQEKKPHQAVAPEAPVAQERTVVKEPPQSPVQIRIEVSGGTDPEIAGAIATGYLDRAEALLREAIKGNGALPTQKALAAVLAKKAQRDAESGDLKSAVSRLNEASTLSDDAGILSLLSEAQYRSGDLRAAAGILERLPNEAGGRERLKAIYIRLGKEMRDAGDMGSASVFFTKAAKLDPKDVKLTEALDEAGHEDTFEASMGRREGGHFLVKFEGGENTETGHLIGLLLEEAYLKVGHDLGLYPEKRIEALLYSKESFRDITRSPSWAGAIYDGRIKLPAGGITAKTSVLEKVIFHEYTHAVVRELSKGRAPVWLNEGLAQYEEGQSSASFARSLSQLAKNGVIKLKPFEGSFMSFRAEEAQIAYLLSLSATEYIIREFGLFQVRGVLERLGEGMGVDEALSTSLGVSYEDLERGWRSSILAR